MLYPNGFLSFVIFIFIKLINYIMVFEELKTRMRRSNAAANAALSRMEMTPNKNPSTSTTQVTPNLVNNQPSTTANPKYKFIADSFQHPSINRVQSTLTQIVDFSKKQAEANDSLVDSSDDNVSEISEKSKIIDLDEEVKFVKTEDNEVEFVKTSQEDNILCTRTSGSVNTTQDVSDQQYITTRNKEQNKKTSSTRPRKQKNSQSSSQYSTNTTRNQTPRYFFCQYCFSTECHDYLYGPTIKKMIEQDDTITTHDDIVEKFLHTYNIAVKFNTGRKTGIVPKGTLSVPVCLYAGTYLKCVQEKTRIMIMTSKPAAAVTHMGGDRGLGNGLARKSADEEEYNKWMNSAATQNDKKRKRGY
jgi:hypothetical protein